MTQTLPECDLNFLRYFPQFANLNLQFISVQFVGVITTSIIWHSFFIVLKMTIFGLRCSIIFVVVIIIVVTTLTEYRNLRNKKIYKKTLFHNI